MALLEIKHLTLEFVSDNGRVRATNDLSLSVAAGESVCIVGESGCGKSATALSIARLLPAPPATYVRGGIQLEGRDVLEMTNSELCSIRGRVVSYVFQEPGSSLNPVMRVGKQILETLRLHRPEVANEIEVIRLLKQVQIPAAESRVRDYPFQMSGGMQQRVMIAMAIASRPQLLIADEPTTALDVTVQAQILDLLRELKRETGMALVLITHNLGIVRGMADRVAVMYAGEIVELAPADQLIEQPLHPYTRALIASVPRLGQGSRRLMTIPGQVPRLDHRPAGCRFVSRCANARNECSDLKPELMEVAPGRWVRCPFVHEPDAASSPSGSNERA